jgi:hypothetical protein
VGNITQFSAAPSYKRFYSEPAAFDGEPRRLSSDLKKVVVAQELNLWSVYLYNYAMNQRKRTNVLAGKSNTHLSGGVLQIAAVIGLNIGLSAPEKNYSARSYYKIVVAKWVRIPFSVEVFANGTIP